LGDNGVFDSGIIGKAARVSISRRGLGKRGWLTLSFTEDLADPLEALGCDLIEGPQSIYGSRPPQKVGVVANRFEGEKGA
jgi:hypothetical protein